MNRYFVLALCLVSVAALQNPFIEFFQKRRASGDNYIVYPASKVSNPTPIYDYQQIVQENTVANIIILQNPLEGHFSVLPPTTGCGTRQRTSVNSAARGCVAATNAGFFDMKTGACIGNIVSNGEAIQMPCMARGNFGLLKNGSFVIGYLSCDTLAKLEFSQLVQGSVTLVRDGASFVDQSAAIETTSQSFILLKAPRVAIGHDKDGRLIMVQVDGNEGKKLGFDLYQLANLMVKLGAVNAINLDGGGSSTMLVNKNQVKTQCTDSCAGSTEPNLCPNAAAGCCERKVTTIICVS